MLFSSGDNVISCAAEQERQSIRTLLTATVTAATVYDEDVSRYLQRVQNRRTKTGILMSESFTLYGQVYY